VERSFPLSITTRPVTQTAEAEVKSESMKRSWPFEAENGSERSRAPVRITPAKLRIKILGGDRCFEMKFLTLVRILIGWKRPPLPKRLKRTLLENVSSVNSKGLFKRSVGAFHHRPSPNVSTKYFHNDKVKMEGNENGS
jgi:hypothetical protein